VNGFEPAYTTTFQGLPIVIENRKGSVRRGVDQDGHEWETRMMNPYGFIRVRDGRGADGEYIDCYLGPNREAMAVYVIHQQDPETHLYDEDKVMLGFNSQAEAETAYRKHYDKPGYLMETTAFDCVEKFREAMRMMMPGDPVRPPREEKSMDPMFVVPFEKAITVKKGTIKVGDKLRFHFSGTIGEVPGRVVETPESRIHYPPDARPWGVTKGDVSILTMPLDNVGMFKALRSGLVPTKVQVMRNGRAFTQTVYKRPDEAQPAAAPRQMNPEDDVPRGPWISGPPAGEADNFERRALSGMADSQLAKFQKQAEKAYAKTFKLMDPNSKMAQEDREHFQHRLQLVEEEWKRRKGMTKAIRAGLHPEKVPVHRAGKTFMQTVFKRTPKLQAPRKQKKVEPSPGQIGFDFAAEPAQVEPTVTPEATGLWQTLSPEAHEAHAKLREARRNMDYTKMSDKLADETYALQQFGAALVPGLRLQDLDRAALTFEVLAGTDGSVEKWNAYKEKLAAENRIARPKAEATAPAAPAAPAEVQQLPQDETAGYPKLPEDAAEAEKWVNEGRAFLSDDNETMGAHDPATGRPIRLTDETLPMARPPMASESLSQYLLSASETLIAELRHYDGADHAGSDSWREGVNGTRRLLENAIAKGGTDPLAVRREFTKQIMEATAYLDAEKKKEANRKRPTIQSWADHGKAALEDAGAAFRIMFMRWQEKDGPVLQETAETVREDQVYQDPPARPDINALTREQVDSFFKNIESAWYANRVKVFFPAYKDAWKNHHLSRMPMEKREAVEFSGGIWRLVSGVSSFLFEGKRKSTVTQDEIAHELANSRALAEQKIESEAKLNGRSGDDPITQAQRSGLDEAWRFVTLAFKAETENAGTPNGGRSYNQ
jgi:hypothetical protein